MATIIPLAEVLDHLVKIDTSPGFRNAERLRELLEYMIREAIGGRGSSLKESVLGVATFGQKPGYDSEANSIVRVEFARLRKKLEHYYEKDGSAETLTNRVSQVLAAASRVTHQEAMRLNSCVRADPRKLPLQAVW